MQIVQRASFPAGSKPWMLRVSPEGHEVWVQTADGSNVVLDATDLRKLHAQRLGTQPVEGAWSPDGRYHVATQLGSDWIAITDTQSYRVAAKVSVGMPQANTSFRPDGKIAYVTVTGSDEVVAVDMDTMEVMARIPTGAKPMGLIVR